MVKEIRQAPEFLPGCLGHFAFGGNVGHRPHHMAGHARQGIAYDPKPAASAIGQGDGKILA